MVNKNIVWWLSGIMLLGVVFRLSIYNMEPLFYDSAYYASLGRSIVEGDYLLQVNHMSDKPPLFFYIQAFLFYLFGVVESVAILPSFVGGMLGIGILYFLGKDLYNSVAGIIAALLYAISPGSVLLSTVGFIDSLFMAFVLFSFWTLLHRRYYMTGLLIGISFGLKQTVLSFGPLYLTWLLILEFHHHSGKDAFLSVAKSTVKMIPGIFIFFLPILYWGIFLTSERMEPFKYITGFISGQQDTQFVVTLPDRIAKMKVDLVQVVGLSWHWMVGILLLSMGLLIVKIFLQKRLKGTILLSDKLLFTVNLFILFFFYLLVFVARKYTGFHYVFPVFPFLILTASITLAQFANTKLYGGDFVIPEKIKTWVLSCTILLFVFPSSVVRVNQIGNSFSNAAHQGVQEVTKELKTYLLTEGESVLFERTLGWLLRYYIYKGDYRREEYFEDGRFLNIKNVLFQEPYSNFYSLFASFHYDDIATIREILFPEYKMEKIFHSPGDNFRFYKIVPISHGKLFGSQKLPEKWEKEWETWWHGILVRKWPEAKKLTIKSHWNKSEQLFEVKLLAEQVPFKDLLVSRMEVIIKSPEPSVKLSQLYNWPVFHKHKGISMQLLINGETMEKSILERFKQVKKIQFSTDQSLTNIHAFGQVENTSLEIDTDVHLVLEPELVRVDIKRFLLNNWDLTWFTNLFKNHPIPPLKINTYPSLELRLTNVKQQKGFIVFDYDAPERMSQ